MRGDAGPQVLDRPEAVSMATSAEDWLPVVLPCICEPVNELDMAIGTGGDNPHPAR